MNRKNDLHTVFLAKDKLYCKWRLQPLLLQAAFYCEKPLNPRVLDLRIFDVTDIYFNGTNAHSVTCIKVETEESSWTIKGLKPNRSYLCELGYLTKEYSFWPVLQSWPVHTAFGRKEEYKQKASAVEAYVYGHTDVQEWITHPDCRRTS